MAGSNELKTVRVTQLFSIRGFALLLIIIAVCYLVWGTWVAILVTSGALVGMLVAVVGVLSRRGGAFQFSMRGLLLFMFMVAVLAVWQQHFLIHSDLAIARIQSLGGEASVRERGDGQLESNAQFIRQQIEPRHLNYLRSLPNLTTLDLDYSHVGDSGMSYVGTLTNLTWLDIEDTEVTDDGLRHLASLNKLEHLIADGNEISDEGLKHLEKLKSLTRLRLRDTNITDRGIAEFKLKVPGCKVIID